MTHFNHTNIIKYCNRPFESVDDMNHQLIQNWNDVVSNEDIIIHGGDFALGKKEQQKEICVQLNGHKILIVGNHDRSPKQMEELGFDEVYQKFEISILVKDKTKRLCFVHRPPDVYFKQKHLGIQYFLHGHTHSYDIQTERNVLNISCEALNFIPMDLEYLIGCY